MKLYTINDSLKIKFNIGIVLGPALYLNLSQIYGKIFLKTKSFWTSILLDISRKKLYRSNNHIKNPCEENPHLYRYLKCYWATDNPHSIATHTQSTVLLK